jgi:hypothetical protein
LACKTKAPRRLPITSKYLARLAWWPPATIAHHSSDFRIGNCSTNRSGFGSVVVCHGCCCCWIPKPPRNNCYCCCSSLKRRRARIVCCCSWICESAAQDSLLCCCYCSSVKRRSATIVCPWTPWNRSCCHGHRGKHTASTGAQIRFHDADV